MGRALYSEIQSDERPIEGVGVVARIGVGAGGRGTVDPDFRHRQRLLQGKWDRICGEEEERGRRGHPIDPIDPRIHPGDISGHRW